MTDRQPCKKCGRTHRSETGLCGPCGRARFKHGDGDVALTGGRWVQRGMTVVYVLDEPAKVYRPRAVAPRCDDCRFILRRDGSCYQCESHVRPIVFPGRPICACGCLLARADEHCPNCAATSERRAA